MNDILRLALQNQEKARKIIEELQLIPIWKSVGADPHLVGSLRMGLLMKHRDIDFHIYSDPLEVSQSFAAIQKMAENPAIRQIEYKNLSDTEEKCIEWHAWYTDHTNELWQIDMIHILKGSFYDGYFEKMADRIVSLLTPETKQLILQLKNDTPESEKIMGVEYYQAVLRDGIQNYADFEKWRIHHPVNGILHWIP